MPKINICYLPICLLIMHIGTLTMAKAQVFLQLEMKNDPETIKFSRGDVLTFKTKSQPKEWISREIIDIKVSENVVVFEDGFRHLEEIISIRLYRRTFDNFTKMIQKFAVGWLVFGGLSLLVVPDSTIPLGALLVSSGAFYGTGWLLNKLFKYRKVKLGSRYRLRLLDLRFP